MSPQRRRATLMETRMRTRSASKGIAAVADDIPKQKINTPKTEHRIRKRKLESTSGDEEPPTVLKQTRRTKYTRRTVNHSSKNNELDVCNGSSTADSNATVSPDLDTTIKNKSLLTVNKFDDVTPRSSPIAVHLSPSRSKKTPRKSPISSDSPKTHSTISIRLSKTPRKLPVMNSSVESSPTTPDDKSQKADKKNVVDTASKSSVKKKERRSGIQQNIFARKFSKSPKIIIRTPKSRSKKSKDSKHQKTKRNRLSGKVTSPIMPSLGKSASPVKNTSHTKKSISPNTSKFSAAKELENKSSLYMEAISREARVVLERIDKATSNTSNKSQRTKPVKKVSDANSSILLQPMPGLDNSSFMESCNELFVNLSVCTSPHDVKTTDKRIVSSPRSRIKRMLDLSSDSESNRFPKTANSPHQVQTRYVVDKTKIEPETFNLSTNTSMDNTTITNASQNGTFSVNGETDREENNGNTTYEVLEPITPDLRQRARKRKSEEADLCHNEENPKRPHKVHFATPTVNKIHAPSRHTLHTPLILPRSNKAAEKRAIISAQKMKITGVQNTKEKSLSIDTPTSNHRRRLNSNPTSTIPARIISAALSKRRSNSLTAANSSLIKNSITPKNNIPDNHNKSKLSTITKSDLKTTKQPSSARKVPNFAEIHQKKFAEMESLVDAKKRIANRHKAFMNKVHLKPAENTKSPKASDTVSGNYNRFGFKIRKDEARNLVTLKEPTTKRKDRQEEQRSVLKGIRLNRRFELHMKSRKINI